MIHPALYIGNSEGRGHGVFTSEDIPEHTVVEISPVIVMKKEERELLDKTLLHDYIFEWVAEKDNPKAIGCCMALGYVAVYNHSFMSNCEHEMNYEEGTISIKTIRNINAGEELFINYNGNWNDAKPLWFDAL